MANISSETDVNITTETGLILITEIVSIRGKILQEFIDRLETISQANGYNTDVNYVSSNLSIKHPEELDGDQYPACFPIDDTEQKEGFAIFSDTGDNLDTKSILTVFVTTIIKSKTGDTFDQRHSLILDIERAIVTDTVLFDRTTSTGLLLEPAMPASVETDKGYFDGFSVFDQAFLCEYAYNHSTGGN